MLLGKDLNVMRSDHILVLYISNPSIVLRIIAAISSALEVQFSFLLLLIRGYRVSICHFT